MKNARVLMTGLPMGIMSPDREKALMTALKSRSSKAIREQAGMDLILGTMNEAFFYARRCCRGMMDDGNLYSVCYTALGKALKNFIPGGLRFFAYAKVYVRGGVCAEWKTFDVVRHSSQHTTLEPAEAHLPPEERINDESGFRPRHAHPDFENVAMPDETGNRTGEIWKRLEPFIKSELCPREQQVVSMFYLQDLNFSQIGGLLGVTRQAISFTHKTALRKLNCAMRGKRALFE